MARLIVTGSGGFLGRAFCLAAEAAGHELIKLRHAPSSAKEATFYQLSPALKDRLSGADACVHLAGEPILGYWTPAKKQAILHSRQVGTRALCELLAALPQPPERLLSASAVGFYGSCGAASLDEHSPQGDGFLADTTAAWEASTAAASEAGINVAHLRFGVLLHSEGGALKAMHPAFQAGVAGPLGSGEQGMSWIHRDDAVSALLHLLTQPTPLAKAYNVVAPQPVSNRCFTVAFHAALNSPSCLPLGWLQRLAVPASLLKLLLGEVATVVLDSQYATPAALLASGFSFQYPTLPAALDACVTVAQNRELPS